MGFLQIRFIDILDIFLVAFLLFQLYRLIKGTVALNIFVGLFLFIVFWLMVKALNMDLTGSILDNLISVGVIAIIVLFQEEIRKFLLLIGSKYNFNQWFSLDKVMAKGESGMLNIYIKPIVSAVERMAETKTGALIIIARSSELLDVSKTGELLNAVISSAMLESIFFKNSPLHDGAVIIAQNKIKAARCILPISHNTDLPSSLGLRHRAALGISQKTDAQVIIVSEETGNISFAQGGKLTVAISSLELKTLLVGN